MVNPKLDPVKLQKLQDLRQNNVNPYPYTYSQTHHAQQLKNQFEKLNPEEHTKQHVSIAGRIMLRRVMGKASFFHVQDETGQIQIYITQDNVGEEQYAQLTKKTDLGDIIGVQGTIFKTKMGEVTIQVSQAQILCKSLLVLPEKFHGLKDVEIRYRQRYLDLISNPSSKEVFKQRSMITTAIRDYFNEKGFLEVETPTLQTIYGGANAKPFITHINTWDMKMYLSIAPELPLKRLLVGGFEKVYTICKNFRNEDVDTTHNPEFTSLEIYQAYVDYSKMMVYLEEVYEKACIKIHGTTKVKRIYKNQEVTLDFKAPWKRLTMLDAIKQYTKIDASNSSIEQLQKILNKENIEYEKPLSWGSAVQHLFEHFVEEHLIQPTHIIDHPKETTPLCKAHRKDPRLIERFESFCMGMEISNAYSELNDPLLQRELLEDQAKSLRAGSAEAHPMDEDFVTAIEFGMPPAGGLGFGIDRMAIILTGVESIRDVILFPTVKPEHISQTQTGKAKETKIAVAVINKAAKLEPWQEMNTIAHLNAAFAARMGRELLLQDTIETKDGEKIKLNIQHAIMIKTASSQKQLQDLIENAHNRNLEIAQFTREMQETTNDNVVIEKTKQKKADQVEYLGILVFGNKKDVDEISKSFALYK
ncbi:lysine--tRNA ligase [Candidatus Woesearchaeota archaeon]|nr:lysine--tRNA ligase [Candidatus Woesearchaeota archaeon]